MPRQYRLLSIRMTILALTLLGTSSQLQPLAAQGDESAGSTESSGSFRAAFGRFLGGRGDSTDEPLAASKEDRNSLPSARFNTSRSTPRASLFGSSRSTDESSESKAPARPVQPSPQRSNTSASRDNQSKPESTRSGLFGGGFFHQLTGITGGDDDLSGLNSEERAVATRQPAGLPAAENYQEPFAKPAIAAPSKTTTVTANQPSNLAASNLSPPGSNGDSSAAGALSRPLPQIVTPSQALNRQTGSSPNNSAANNSTSQSKYSAAAAATRETQAIEPVRRMYVEPLDSDRSSRRASSQSAVVSSESLVQAVPQLRANPESTTAATSTATKQSNGDTMTRIAADDREFAVSRKTAGSTSTTALPDPVSLQNGSTMSPINRTSQPLNTPPRIPTSYNSPLKDLAGSSVAAVPPATAIASPSAMQLPPATTATNSSQETYSLQLPRNSTPAIPASTAGSTRATTSTTTADANSSSSLALPLPTNLNSEMTAANANPAPRPEFVVGDSSSSTKNNSIYGSSNNVPPASSDDPSKARLLEMVIPQIRLWVEGPAKLKVNTPATYRVFAKNEGQSEVVGLLVSTLVPAGVTSKDVKVAAGTLEAEDLEDGSKSILWQLPELPAGQTRTLTAELSALRPEHFGMDIEWTVLPETGTLDINAVQPQLVVAIEGASEVLYGKPEMYRLRVRNPGNADVKDAEVFMTAESFGTQKSKIGDLAAGQERIVEVELTFQKSGRMSISGGAESKVSQLQAESKIDVTVKQIQLQTACVAPERQFQGAIAPYTFEIVNEGDVVAQDVRCEILLPAGALAASLPEGVAQSGNKLFWVLKNVAARETKQITVPIQMNETGSLNIEVNAANEHGSNANCKALVMVESISDLILTVADPVAPAPVSEKVVYELVVQNRGSKTARNVTVLAQFSEGIEPIGFEGEAAQMVTGQVVFDPISKIEAGQSAVLRVIAVASVPGMHRFRAEVQCDDGETHLIQEESTRYLRTAMSSSKTITR